MRLVALFLAIGWCLVACGGPETDYDYGDETPPPADPAFVAVQPVVDRECGRCHNGSVHPLKFSSGAAFKGSKAKARIGNGTMPPDRALKPEDKQALLDYLG